MTKSKKIQRLIHHIQNQEQRRQEGWEVYAVYRYVKTEYRTGYGPGIVVLGGESDPKIVSCPYKDTIDMWKRERPLLSQDDVNEAKIYARELGFKPTVVKVTIYRRKCTNDHSRKTA